MGERLRLESDEVRDVCIAERLRLRTLDPDPDDVVLVSEMLMLDKGEEAAVLGIDIVCIGSDELAPKRSPLVDGREAVALRYVLVGKESEELNERSVLGIEVVVPGMDTAAIDRPD